LGTKTSTPKKISASLSKKLNDFRDFYISNLFPHISYRPQKPFNDALKAANAINPDLLLTTVGTSLTAIAQPMPWYKRLMNKRG
jgi:hypothetical protein